MPARDAGAATFFLTTYERADASVLQPQKVNPSRDLQLPGHTNGCLVANPAFFAPLKANNNLPGAVPLQSRGWGTTRTPSSSRAAGRASGAVWRRRSISSAIA